jgi:hypothetical protein
MKTGAAMPFNFRRKPLPLKAVKVLVINFRPAAVPAIWGNTSQLIEEYIEGILQASQRYLLYKIAAKLDVPKYPVLMDGRQYNDATWTRAIQDDKTAFRDAQGNYVMADYVRILQEFNIFQGIQTGQIHEVWMFGGPYFGFYESRMVGKGAFWCNAPGIEYNCRRFVMMGFNYQRGAQEMIHSFGHRAESILCRKFNSQDFQNRLYSQQPIPTPKNPFEQWLLEHGTVHRKPGGADYGQNEFVWASALKTEWWPLIMDPEKVL